MSDFNVKHDKDGGFSVEHKATNQLPTQQPDELSHDSEDVLERCFWEYDERRKNTGEERLSFKGKMRWFASYICNLRSNKLEPLVEGTKLWLWRNFVDGKPEYLAFDNPYPSESLCGDPLTLGEPCGYAILKPSVNGRPEVSHAEVIEVIRRATERESGNLANPTGATVEQSTGNLTDFVRKNIHPPYPPARDEDEVRQFQRHRLLRYFGEDGKVPAVCIDASLLLDRLLNEIVLLQAEIAFYDSVNSRLSKEFSPLMAFKDALKEHKRNERKGEQQ